MNTWTWVLIGLCALGFLLAVFSVVPVIRYAIRLRSRVRQLGDSQLMTSLGSLQMQSNRLTRSQRDVQILMRRWTAVSSSLQEAAPKSGLPAMRAAAEETREEIRRLITDLE